MYLVFIRVKVPGSSRPLAQSQKSSLMMEAGKVFSLHLL
jgi:hypothetical protein